MKKKTLILLPLLAAVWIGAQAQTTEAAAPAAAAASAPEPTPSPFTGNINVTSNYKFRGQDQGTLNAWSPAVQGGFDWTQNGFYLGNWNSNVSFAGNIEMDLYGGYRGEITKEWTYDVGILQYYYPRNNDTTPFNFDTTEIYGSLTYSFFTLKYSHTVSTDYFALGRINQANNGLATRASGRNTGYLDLSANYEVLKGLTLNGHVGYTRLAGDLRDAVNTVTNPDDSVTTTKAYANYTDWKVGATYDLGSGFSLAGAVVGASDRSVWGDVNKTRFIVTLGKTL
jgi:uncharacterized protein (TIGR02001 family)